MSWLSAYTKAKYGIPEINLTAAAAAIEKGDIKGFFKALPAPIEHEIVRYVATELLAEIEDQIPAAVRPLVDGALDAAVGRLAD